MIHTCSINSNPKIEMKLGEFLKKNGLSKERFAKAAGLTQNIIANGVHFRPVGLIPALKIEKATYGAVRPIDLLPDDVKRDEGLVDG